MKTLEIYFTEVYHNERVHFTVTHVEADVVEPGMLVVHHTEADNDGFVWTDVYPIATIDWYRWHIEDEKATDTVGQTAS